MTPLEACQAEERTLRLRRQDMVDRLVRAKRQLWGVYVARAALTVAVVGFGWSSWPASSSLLLWIAVICLIGLFHNIRKAGPQARATVGLWNEQYETVHAEWDAALQRLLDAEAKPG